MKMFRSRTKFEAFGAVCVVVLLVAVSVMAGTRVITDSSDNLASFITNSNGGVWDATWDNVQLASWNLNDTGGTVKLPDGDLEAVYQIVITNDAITIQGHAWRNRFYEPGTRIHATAGLENSSIFTTNRNSTEFKYIAFVGRGVNDGYGNNAINITGVSNNAHIYGCSFNSFGGDAIHVATSDSHGVRIDSCRGININGSFVDTHGVDGWITECDATSDDHIFNISTASNKIMGCNAFLGGKDGIHITGSSVTVSDNRCNDNTGHGMYVQSSSSTISNNKILDNGECGIYLYGNGNTITGNNILRSDETGIRIEDVDQNVIVGNKIDSSGEDASIADKYESGIYTINALENVIVGNRMKSAKYGIFEENTGGIFNTNLIHSNNLRGNDVAGYTDDDGTTDSIRIHNLGYDNNTLFPFLSQATVPSVADNCTLFWHNSTSDNFYTVANTYGSYRYLNWTTTI